MSRKQTIYRTIETVIGRDLSWRVGRFLYLGGRRELGNDPATNGEYALIAWIMESGGGASTRLMVEQPRVFIDVGANVGFWSGAVLQAARDHGRAVHIHAFEPAPVQNGALTRRLSSVGGGQQVHVHRQAVGAVAAPSRFMVTGPSAGTSALRSGFATPPGDEIEVDVVTLDGVAEQFGLSQITLVKVDTEGNDFNVLSGASGLLKSGNIGVLQFEYNWRWVGFGHRLWDVFSAIAGLPYHLGRLTGSAVEVYDAWHPELEQYHEANYVLVRRDVLPTLPHEMVAFGPAGTPCRK